VIELGKLAETSVVKSRPSVPHGAKCMLNHCLLWCVNELRPRQAVV